MPRPVCPIRTGDSEEPDGDPHWWHDPVLYERAARALAAELGRVDPHHWAAYAANAARYVAQLQAMDAANKRVVACLPVDDRKLVTNHDAFGYFAAHYGIQSGRIGDPVDLDRGGAERPQRGRPDRPDQGQHVRAVFTESSLNPALENQIAARRA